MFAVIVNTLTVLIGASLGLLLHRGIPERIINALMIALGLCTIYIGIDGALVGENALVTILSMCIGVAVGELLDLEGKLNGFSHLIEKKFAKGSGKISIAQGFMTASVLFCIGSMTIVGAMQAGINGDNTMLLTKSTLDLISSFALAASLGIGVLLAAVFVLVFEGGLVLLAQYIAPFMTDYVINEITCAGSLIIIAIGLNLIGLTNIKCANFLPAIFLPVILCLFM